MTIFNDIQSKKSAIALIEETIKDVESTSDRAYATGLIEMASELGAISKEQSFRYKAVLYSMKIKD